MQLLGHVDAGGVHGGRIRQGDDGDAVLGGDFDLFVGHGHSNGALTLGSSTAATLNLPRRGPPSGD